MPTHILAHLAAPRTGDRFAAKRAKILPTHPIKMILIDLQYDNREKT